MGRSLIQTHCFKFAVREYFQVSGTDTKVGFVLEFDIENWYYPSLKIWTVRWKWEHIYIYTYAYEYEYIFMYMYIYICISKRNDSST